MAYNLALEPLGKDTRALWTKNPEVEKQSIYVGSGTEQVSLRGCFTLGAAKLSIDVVLKSATLSSSTAILIPAVTLASSNLMQMERSRRSNSLFCCGFFVRFRFFLNNTIPNTLVDYCTEG